MSSPWPIHQAWGSYHMGSTRSSFSGSLGAVGTYRQLRSISPTATVSSRSSLSSYNLDTLYGRPSNYNSVRSSNLTSGGSFARPIPRPKPVAAVASKAKSFSPGLVTAGAVTGTIGGLFHLGGSVAHAKALKYQADTQARMQDKRLDFANSYISNRQTALKNVGLPDYLGYGVGGSSNYPTVTQNHSGMNAYHARIPGDPTSNAFNGSYAQISNGWGNVM
jgi:hypothetical protein